MYVMRVLAPVLEHRPGCVGYTYLPPSVSEGKETFFEDCLPKNLRTLHMITTAAACGP